MPNNHHDLPALSIKRKKPKVQREVSFAPWDKRTRGVLFLPVGGIQRQEDNDQAHQMTTGEA